MKLIINADDLGMSEAVNTAIFAAFDEGHLRSASLLAHGPAFDRAVAGLRSRPGLGVGVHLDSTEFTGAPWLDQIARVRDAGVVPDHLDSHQHAHLRWAQLRALREVCVTSGILAIRGRSTAYGPAVLSRVWRQCVRFARMPDQFFALDHFLAKGSPEQPGWTEIMVHPGNPSHARYADELRALPEVVRGHTIGRFSDAFG